MFTKVTEGKTLSNDELKQHLKGLEPDDLKMSECGSEIICYVLSQISRTAIVLSTGEFKNAPSVRQKALDQLFEYS